MKQLITASRLNEALDDANITAQELSDLTGISKSSISQYRSGRCIPKREGAEKIGMILQVSPLWLLGFDVLKHPLEGNKEVEIQTESQTIPEENVVVGERIKTRRKQLGITQQELADKLGYKGRSSINKIELSKRNLPPKKIKQIADMLLTTPEYIMGWEEDFDDNENRNYILRYLRIADDDTLRELRLYIDFLERKKVMQ